MSKRLSEIVEMPDLNKELKKEQNEVKRLKRIIEHHAIKGRDYRIPVKTKSNTIKYGVIGDTHIGSLYERIDALNEFYNILEKEKVEMVLHAGDVLAGHKVYRGQEFDLYAIGFQQQLEALTKKFPRSKLRTYFITGNHDASFKNQSGIDVGKQIAIRRPDLIYMGEDISNIKIKVGKAVIKYQLVHPSGGTAYAVSYKSQKMIESYEGGKKPRAVFIGHYHKADYMPMFRNVRALQVGCFESQTPFMLRKPTPAHVGGWIIEDTVGKGLADRFKAEFISFYEPQEVKNLDRNA